MPKHSTAQIFLICHVASSDRFASPPTQPGSRLQDIESASISQRGTTRIMPTEQTGRGVLWVINVGKPVGVGLVESLSRPGSNVTGFGDSIH